MIDIKSIYTFDEMKAALTETQEELRRHHHDSRYLSTMPTWEDIRSPASAAGKPTANFPNWSQFETETYAWEFAKNFDQKLHFDIQLAHARKPGTELRLHIHWSPSDTSVGDVLWRVYYTIADVHGAFPLESNAQMIGTTSGVLRTHEYTTIVRIDGTSFTGVSTMMKVTLYRVGTDQTDDYENGAFLHELDVHYLGEKTGPRQEFRNY